MADIPYFFYTSRELGYVPPPGIEAPPKSTCTNGVSLDLATLADGRGVITPQIPELLNAAQLVGMYPGDPKTTRGPTLNSNEMSWREFSLKNTITELPDKSIGSSVVYRLVDAADSGALSFQMGQTLMATVAAMNAEQAGPSALPGVLMSTDRWTRVVPALPFEMRTNRSPDLMSQMGANSFQIWAAGCRNTNGVLWSALRDGFSRAWSAAEVAGLTPEAYVAGLCRTDPSEANRWEIHVVDPGEGGRMPIPLETQDGILRQYYYPLWHILKLNKNTACRRKVGGESFTAVRRPGSDCLLGIDEKILRLLQLDEKKRFSDGELFKRIQSVLGEGYNNRAESRNTFVNINGVLTEVGQSWLDL